MTSASPVRIHITDHARKRGKQRCNLRGKTFDRRAEQAWWNGLMAHEAQGELAIWLAAKQKTNPAVNAARVFQGFAWMFAGERLVTVLIVPKGLKEAA